MGEKFIGEKVKVLIVDDEYAFCRTMKLFFKKLGFEPVIATNGEHALDLIAEIKPQFMTLDIRMPGMNGYELLQKIKRHRDDIYTIIITAIEVPRMEEMLEHSGAHAVLRKPVDLQELSEVIYTHLALKH